MGSHCDHEVACSASDHQGNYFDFFIWRAVSSDSSHPASTKHFFNICTTSARRFRRWFNIVQMLYKIFVLRLLGSVFMGSSWPSLAQMWPEAAFIHNTFVLIRYCCIDVGPVRTWYLVHPPLCPTNKHGRPLTLIKHGHCSRHLSGVSGERLAGPHLYRRLPCWQSIPPVSKGALLSWSWRPPLSASLVNLCFPVLLCKAKRQYLLTCKVSRYCLLDLHPAVFPSRVVRWRSAEPFCPGTVLVVTLLAAFVTQAGERGGGMELILELKSEKGSISGTGEKRK